VVAETSPSNHRTKIFIFCFLIIDAASLSTKAVKDGDDYVLNGSKVDFSF